MLVKLAIFFFLSFLLKKEGKRKGERRSKSSCHQFSCCPKNIPKIMNHPNFSFLGCCLQLIVRKDGIHIKEILKRETFASLNYEKHKMSFTHPSSLLCNLNNYTSSYFRILSNHDKLKGLSANGEILIKRIVSLL